DVLDRNHLLAPDGHVVQRLALFAVNRHQLRVRFPMRHLIIPVMLLAAPSLAVAQEAPSTPASIAFPGSVNMTVGNVTPTEPGNVVSLTMLEQGVTVWRHKNTFLSGLAQLSVGRASDHYAWNNRRPVTVGVRFSQVISNSVLQLNVGESVVSDT